MSVTRVQVGGEHPYPVVVGTGVLGELPSLIGPGVRTVVVIHPAGLAAIARPVSGALTAAGAPVRISGKVSWDGEIDARVDGKLPAGMVRFVVPDIFEKLDGIVTAEVRVTGNVSDPIIVGTGRAEEGILSFKGYAQQFEGLKGEAILSREKIVIERFEGRSGGGYIDGWGEIPLQVDAGQRLYFAVDFFDVRYP
ncbi:MAG: hypothetical protein LBI49_04165, partial [Nocardiopsaceae bacterium]|nr:hypothetical protein [Nocardiopsaceae bacterium]